MALLVDKLAMSGQDANSLRPTHLFPEEEWDAELSRLTAGMNDHLAKYRTPLFIDQVEYGEPHGSGSFLELNDRIYILTNEHVASVRSESVQLGYHLVDEENLPVVRGNHPAREWPWDLAVLPVNAELWRSEKGAACAINVERIALAHTPVDEEIFAFSGFAGERTTFLFKEMQFGATTSLSREAEFPSHGKIDPRFHFALDYRPDLATTVVGHHGLPQPPGLSGSTVWNTCFVEAKQQGIDWTPDLAMVTGVVWGWPSQHGVIVATKAEHLRSFLLGVAKVLGDDA